MTYFLGLFYLGFGKLIPASANSCFPPAPTSSASLLCCLPPRQSAVAWCLLPTPAPHMACMVQEMLLNPQCITVPQVRFLKSLPPQPPPCRQPSTLNQPASYWILPVNPTCLTAWSIHPPDKIHNPPPSPSPWSVKFVSPNSTPTYPCRRTPHYTPEKSPRRIFIYFFVGKRIGGGFASPWAFWTTPALLRLQPPQTNPIATANLIISSPALFMLGSSLTTPCTSSSLEVCDKTLEI